MGFSNFPAAILREMNFSWFQKVKNCHFLTILEALNIDFWNNFTVENVQSSQEFKIQSCSNGSNWQFLGLKNEQN